MRGFGIGGLGARAAQGDTAAIFALLLIAAALVALVWLVQWFAKQ